MDKGSIVFSKEDFDQLTIISKMSWKNLKYEGIRNIQKIVKKISVDFQSYYVEKNIKSQNVQDQENERSIIKDNLKEKLKEISDKINEYLLHKIFNYYKEGCKSLMDTKTGDVGFLMIFYCDEHYFNILQGKEAERTDTIIDIQEELPDKDNIATHEKWKKIVKQFKKRKDETKEYIKLYRKILELDKVGKDFVNLYMERMAKHKAEVFKNEKAKK